MYRLLFLFSLFTGCQSISENWSKCDYGLDLPTSVNKNDTLGFQIEYPDKWHVKPNETNSFLLDLSLIDTSAARVVNIYITVSEDDPSDIIRDMKSEVGFGWLTAVEEVMILDQKFDVTIYKTPIFKSLRMAIKYCSALTTVNGKTVIITQWIPNIKDYPHQEFCELKLLLNSFRLCVS